MSIKGSKIIFQGDSITDAGRNFEDKNPNSGLGGGYALFTAHRLQIMMPEKQLQCFNRGISGNRVVDLYARWKVDTLNLNPDMISILIGVNDIWHEIDFNNGVEPERYETIYRLLLEWTRKELPQVQFVLCQPFVLVTGAVKAEWLPDVRQRGEIVKSLAKKFDATFVPFQDAFDAAAKKAPANYWLSDGVHPTGAGHMLMTDTWLNAVLK